jgi:hypothetical protein
MTAWLRIQHDNTQEGENYRKTITYRAMDQATRHSVITSSLTVLGALQRAIQELLGSARWYGTMPIGYLVVWIIALYGDREETIANEELIQEGKKERKKKWMKSERKRRKEHKRKEGNAEMPYRLLRRRVRIILRGTRSLRRTIRRREMRYIPPELHRGGAERHPQAVVPEEPTSQDSKAQQMGDGNDSAQSTKGRTSEVRTVPPLQFGLQRWGVRLHLFLAGSRGVLRGFFGF